MNLDEVPQGERIYIDANILIYHFSRVSTECRSFLARCESKQLEAFTGTHVLLEGLGVLDARLRGHDGLVLLKIIVVNY